MQSYRWWETLHNRICCIQEGHQIFDMRNKYLLYAKEPLNTAYMQQSCMYADVTRCTLCIVVILSSSEETVTTCQSQTDKKSVGIIDFLAHWDERDATAAASSSPEGAEGWRVRWPSGSVAVDVLPWWRLFVYVCTGIGRVCLLFYDNYVYLTGSIAYGDIYIYIYIQFIYLLFYFTIYLIRN